MEGRPITKLGSSSASWVKIQIQPAELATNNLTQLAQPTDSGFFQTQLDSLFLCIVFLLFIALVIR